ncbi:hypothetical protein BY458DRAFT_555631 [Sporodiniella umbellata]|nr:hypothetical protein BY458DRAFT_555631 [Sporodiniella umbellata]
MYWPCLLLIVAVSAYELGQLCDPLPRYKPGTFEYLDSCKNIYLFCDPVSNQCQYKGCSNTDYIKNWDTSFRPMPKRCNTNTTYCPDSNSDCQPLLSIGAHCELQRDDECAGGTNSICLNSTCFMKGAPLGGNCGSDTTFYTTEDTEEGEIQQIIVRDNCTGGTYCLGSMCVASKELGAECEQDRECLSGACSDNERCVPGPDVFRVIQDWLWGVLATAVVLFAVLVLSLLWLLHRYQSKKERAKMDRFFGDNQEFTKYAMLDEDNSSTVYLRTPDYLHSQALSTSHKNPSSMSLHQPTDKLS